MISQYVEIRSDDIAPCKTAADLLCNTMSTLSEFASGDAFDIPADIVSIIHERAAAEEFLSSRINLRTQIPQALGTRAVSVENKLQRFLASMLAETPEPREWSLGKRLSQIASFTTDMGTELSMGDYFSAEWQKLMPPWLLRGSHTLCRCAW